MDAALLRLSVRHPDRPGIRLWLCADGTAIAAVPGAYTITGRCQVLYKRADLEKGIFFGYPTRPGGDERMRLAAREFIAHNGCARSPGMAKDDVNIGVNVIALEDERRLRRWQEQVVGTLGAFRDLQTAPTDSVNPLIADKWVRIMCDYAAEGVWAKDGGGCCVDDLPVSPWLTARIRRWQARYEQKDSGTLIRDWPEGAAFAAEGLAIARAVKAELPDWTVVYFDEAEMEARWPRDRARTRRRWRRALAAGLSKRAARGALDRMRRREPRGRFEYEVT